MRFNLIRFLHVLFLFIPLQAKPRHYDASTKQSNPLAVDDNNEHCSFSLLKKPKQGWICTLCQITTNHEKGLNNHF